MHPSLRQLLTLRCDFLWFRFDRPILLKGVILAETTLAPMLMTLHLSFLRMWATWFMLWVQKQVVRLKTALPVPVTILLLALKWNRGVSGLNALLAVIPVLVGMFAIIAGRKNDLFSLRCPLLAMTWLLPVSILVTRLLIPLSVVLPTRGLAAMFLANLLFMASALIVRVS